LHRRLLLVALGLFAIRLALLAALLPPWQQPDEHVHVAVAELWRSHIRGEPEDDTRQTEILQSMAANGWWRHYTGGDPPDPLPSRFDHTGDVSDTIGVDVMRSAYPPAYYGAVGLLLAPFPQRPVTADLTAMRVLSALLALATLVVAWRASGEALGADAAALAALLLALHPQFAIVSTAASPDAAVALCGALVVWMAWQVVQGERRWRSLVVLWAVALLAAEIDRSGAPLIAVAAGASLFAAGGRRAFGAGVALACVAVAALMMWVGMEALLPLPRTRTAAYVLEFHRMFFDTWWFAAGWLHYRAPHWWLIVAMAIAALAAIGVARTLIVDARSRAALVLAAGALALQVAAVDWTYYRTEIGPQGRYLFPVMVPMLWLMVLGLTGLVPPAHRVRAAAMLVIVFALLDTTVQMLVTLPAYAF
jgi:hypothetical protein